MKKERLWQSFLNLGAVQWCAASLIAGYILFVRWTCRFTMHGQGPVREHQKEKNPLIIVFWHSRIAMILFGRTPHSSWPISMLISQHRDGQIIGKVARFFGFQPVFFPPGSDHKGLILRRLLALLKKGHSVGITPDGPKGPVRRAKSGVFAAALASQCSTVALSFSVSRRVRARSWDRFFIPLPFGRFDLVFSPLIPAPTHRDQEARFLDRVEQLLNEATEKANKLCRLPDKD